MTTANIEKPKKSDPELKQARKKRRKAAIDFYNSEYEFFDESASPLRRMLRRISRVLLMPWRRVKGVLRHWELGDLVLEKSFGLRRLTRSMMKFDGASRLTRDDDGYMVVAEWPKAKTLCNPLWWVVWSSQFVWRWFLSRPFFMLASAIPGVGAIALFFGVATIGGSVPIAAKSMLNRQQMVSNAEAQDFDSARLFGNAALNLAPRNQHVVFDRAKVAEMSGHPAAAILLMEYGARELGDPKSALWLAGNIGDRNQIATWNSQQQAGYAEMLEIALAQESGNVEVRKALAELRMIQGRKREAHQILLPIAGADRDASLLTVILERDLGLGDAARKRASDLLDGLEQEILTSPEKLSLRLQAARLLAFLEQREQAVALLREGLDYADNTQELAILHRALADGYVMMSNQLATKDHSPRGVMARFENLRKAVEYDATSQAVIDAVTLACADVSESKNQELRILKEAIVQGVAPDASHFILGTLALHEGDIDAATRHLEIAVEKNPNLPGLLNNLAYAMTQQAEPDLKKALDLANAAVGATPNNAYARETRGQILIKLERWSEGISDLEFALMAPELRSLIRPSLAIAYDHLGQPEIAERHRKLARNGG